MNSEKLKFQILTTPSLEDLDFLTDRINSEAIDHGSAYPFAILLRNKENEIVAGCNGSIVFGSIYTDQLWVNPNFRKQGLGKKLMEAVHEYGKKQGCTIATVATMSFQVPNFYKAIGYKIDFSRKNYSKGASCIFMSKKL